MLKTASERKLLENVSLNINEAEGETIKYFLFEHMLLNLWHLIQVQKVILYLFYYYLKILPNCKYLLSCSFNFLL